MRKQNRSPYIRWEGTQMQQEPEKRVGSYRSVQIGVFFAALFLLAVISWIIPLHPKTSEAEKRDLAQFPAFSWAALTSGDYFDDINTWFADTFPFRDVYVSLNGQFKALLSPSGTTVHGEVGQGDEIPDQPVAPPADDASTQEPSGGEEADLPANGEEEPSHEIEEPDMTDVPVETLGAILIAGDTAYEYYNFSQSAADMYTAAVNKAASQLAGKANVYDMIVPTSMDITLPASVRKSVNSSDQRKALDYMYGSLSEAVRKVDVYDTLRNHRDEYIYFRTDHHWTALGAYYAYQDYCRARGTEPADLEKDFTAVEYPGFLGSFYSDSGKNAALAGGDTVTAYKPNDTNSLRFTASDGSSVQWMVVSDVSTWNASSKYSCFIGGDNPWTVIENPNKTDGSTCIVVKESFGNCFAPFLVNHYEQVYVVDQRYFSKVKSEKLAALVEETGATDVLFLNNVSATRNESLMKALSSLVG